MTNNYKSLLTLLLLMGFSLLNAQTVLEENFEAGVIPAGWTQQTNASDGGWIVGSSDDNSSQYWNIPFNGSSQIAATNDDACNCNKSNDLLITPAVDLSSYTTALLEVDIFYSDNTLQGNTERASVEASTDGGQTWTRLEQLEGTTGWETRLFNLTDYAGMDEVQIGFRYSDRGAWLYGFAIDNVKIRIPLELDAKLSTLSSLRFGEEGTAHPVTGTIINEGGMTINSLEISYTVDGGSSITATIDGLNIAPLEEYDFTHPTPWTPSGTGQTNLSVSITAVNGMADEEPSNNDLDTQVEIFPGVVIPNKIADFLNSEPVTVVISKPSDGLNLPSDLDFFPVLGKNELWVINQRNANIGGSTVTYNNTGLPNQTALNRVDGNAWHFMSVPTALAFGENGNWASAPGVQDANHNGGTFTGPTLWSSDIEIYAQPSGGNGSHLDMLHGSPYSMGIAHEVDNVYWIFDSWNRTLVRYDFVDDHGPGNDYHGDALVRRYTEISVSRDGNVPSHMILDKSTGWLYVVDNGSDRVLRLDINSGGVSESMPLINEPLTEHSRVTNIDWEVIIDQGLDRPCGIELFENYLMVGDYATGEIIVYDMEDNFTELGRIDTGAPGLTGIKMGPDGNIWYTNRTENTVSRVEPGQAVSTQDPEFDARIIVSPNPTAGELNVRWPSRNAIGPVVLQLTDVTGKLIWSGQTYDRSYDLELNNVANGLYFLNLRSEGAVYTKRIVVQK
ncbi:MAG: choice-of-anchor J domain-containing protein [Bacteroidota bacterium]